MMESKGIGKLDDGNSDFENASHDGRAAVAGGVTGTVSKRHSPEVPIKGAIMAVDGLASAELCSKDAVKGKYPGYLLEGYGLSWWLCRRRWHPECR